MLIEKQDDNKNPILKNSNFLKPILNPNIPVPKPPYLPPSSKSNICLLKTLVSFNCRSLPQKNWVNWVDSLTQTHQELWKKVGIFDAIKSTTYKMKNHNELIICLAEKWCSETNTFVFPFGEATVTLEDVMVLGGFSVLGECVRTLGFDDNEEKLLSFFDNGSNDGSTNVQHCEWIEQFTGFGGELEHFAFLVVWLSRYVFPTQSVGYICSNVFSIAICLARGTRIALAPAILAAIYRDLGLLKARIVDFLSGGGVNGSKLVLWAPFSLVQLWVLERFTILGSEPVSSLCGEPRLARWQNTRKANIRLLRFEFESLGECFLWRPYGLYVTNRDKGRLVSINSEVSEELMSFARCLRPCELVGLDCIEQYNPHRVMMQFGMDQDIPCSVSRCNQSLEVAWSSYNKPLDGVVECLPPRHLRSEVTARYFDWWRTESYQFNTKRRSKRIARNRNLNFDGGKHGIRYAICLSSSSSVSMASRSIHCVEDTGTTETSPPCNKNPSPSGNFTECTKSPSQRIDEISPLSFQSLSKSDHVNSAHGMVIESTLTNPCKFHAQNVGVNESEMMSSQKISRAEDIPSPSSNQVDISEDVPSRNPKRVNFDLSPNVDSVGLEDICSEAVPCSPVNVSANVDEMYMDANPSLGRTVHDCKNVTQNVHKNGNDKTKSGPLFFQSTFNVNVCVGSVASTSIYRVDEMDIEPRPPCDKSPPPSIEYNKNFGSVDNFEGIETCLPGDKNSRPSGNFVNDCENVPSQRMDEVSPLSSQFDVSAKCDHVIPAHGMLIESTPANPCNFLAKNVGVNDSEIVSSQNSLRGEDIPPLTSSEDVLSRDVKRVKFVHDVRLADCIEAAPCSPTNFSADCNEAATPSFDKSVVDCKNLSQNTLKKGNDKTNTEPLCFQSTPKIFVENQDAELARVSNAIVICDEEGSSDADRILAQCLDFESRISKLEEEYKVLEGAAT